MNKGFLEKPMLCGGNMGKERGPVSEGVRKGFLREVVI